MSEGQTSEISQNNPTTDSLMNGSGLTAGQQSAGEMLRQARELRGLPIAALAVLLKVPVKKLEALEADRLDLLPDAVFVRALASSVCRTLKIDSAIILTQLPQTDARNFTYRGAGINEPFRSPGDGPGPSVMAQVSQSAVLAGLLLLMGALVLIFFPVIKTGISEVGLNAIEFKTKNGKTENPPPPMKEAEARLSDSQNVTASSVSLQATSNISAVAAEPVPAAAVNAVVAEVPETAKSPAAVAVSGALPTSLPTLTPSNSSLPTDIVVFTAKTESWVEATDAKGQTVLRRTLAAGEVVGASGALPLKVIVGRANATQVEIRGKAFDVSAVAKDNVARFEVN